MRLIDADTLMHTHESEVAAIGKDWTIDDLATAIETAPTIDAIPVEWLQDKMLNSPKELSISAWRVLNEWHPRKEAQK